MSGSAHNRLGATYFEMLPSNISSLSSASKLPPVRVLLRAAPTLQLDATEALVRLRTAATADAADAAMLAAVNPARAAALAKLTPEQVPITPTLPL